MAHTSGSALQAPPQPHTRACSGHPLALQQRARSCRAAQRRHRPQAQQGTDEQLAERLRRAEAEAKELRARLAATGAQPSAQEQPQKKASRIDGSTLRREGGGGTGAPARARPAGTGCSAQQLLTSPAAENVGQWLSESVVDSLTRLGPAEQGSATAEEAAVVRVGPACSRCMCWTGCSCWCCPRGAGVSPADSKPAAQRRLLIGGAAAVGVAAFALVPTDTLRISRPSKALYLYLIPVIRGEVRGRPSRGRDCGSHGPCPLAAALQELLSDVYDIVSNGRFEGAARCLPHALAPGCSGTA